MKKSLIALAVAGAFAVPTAAMAVDVSFGGEFDVALEAFDDGLDSRNGMHNTHTRFWWDMVDDLGTGLKVKGHLELDVGVNNNHGGNSVNGGNGAGINNRNSYVGLAGDTWGEVRFGTQENGFEAIQYSVDPFHGAAGPGGALVNGMGQSGLPGLSPVCNGTNIGCRRTDQTITYLSPNWGGFNFQIDYVLEGSSGTGTTPGTANATPPVFGATAAPAGSTASDKWNELYIAAKYDAQMWRVYGGIAQISGQSGVVAVPQSLDSDGLRVGGGITWNSLLVDLIIEQNEWEAQGAGPALKIERDGINLNVAYLVPTGKIAFGYTAMDDFDVNGATCGGATGGCATTNTAIGYYHTLSANSSLYAIYNTMDNDTNAQSNMVSGNTALLGGDPSSISLGMYLVF